MFARQSLHEDSVAQYKNDLKEHAHSVDSLLVQLRRQRCRRYGHPAPKVHLHYSDDPDAGRYIIQCNRPHPGDIQGSGALRDFVSAPLDPVLLQELRDRKLARELQHEDELLRRYTAHAKPSSNGRGVTSWSRPPRRVAPYQRGTPRQTAQRGNYPTAREDPQGGVDSAIPVFRRHAIASVRQKPRNFSEVENVGHARAGPSASRRRSPSVEVLEPKVLRLWFFVEDDEPPLQFQLLIPPNADRSSVSLGAYTAEWAEVGVQIGDVVRILAISNERLPAWVPVYLEDLLLPARGDTVVVAHARVKTFHPQLDDLRSLAFAGPLNSCGFSP